VVHFGSNNNHSNSCHKPLVLHNRKLEPIGLYSQCFWLISCLHQRRSRIYRYFVGLERSTKLDDLHKHQLRILNQYHRLCKCRNIQRRLDRESSKRLNSFIRLPGDCYQLVHTNSNYYHSCYCFGDVLRHFNRISYNSCHFSMDPEYGFPTLSRHHLSATN
jgi:hypothetical protein